MRLFGLEHSNFAYRADFGLYGGAIALLALLIAVAGPRDRLGELAALFALGIVGWTLIEYLMHRVVLHGVKPFSTWHAEHHRRPTALIYTPTIVSAALIAALVFVPIWWARDAWTACAITLGVLVGYFAYAVTHHATHHWPATNAWARRRKRWHAMHHSSLAQPGYYGVTSGLWDGLFGSRPARATRGDRATDGRAD